MIVFLSYFLLLSFNFYNIISLVEEKTAEDLEAEALVTGTVIAIHHQEKVLFHDISYLYGISIFG